MNPKSASDILILGGYIMTKSQYLNILEKEVQKLSTKDIESLLDFVGYLKQKEEDDATKEILSDKNLLKSIRRGLADLKAGRIHPLKANK